MIVLSTFGFLHYGKEIIMISICILDLFVSCKAFVSDIQKPLVASRLKGLDYSFQLVYTICYVTHRFD